MKSVHCRELSDGHCSETSFWIGQMDERPDRGGPPIENPLAAAMSHLREFWPGTNDLEPDDDIFMLTGIHGDDAFEFMETYSAKFGVDMREYLWYFHHGEEGLNPGALFVNPPYARVKRIPITLDVLADGIRQGRWPIQYPEHNPPDARWDVWLALPATVFAIAFAVLLASIIIEHLHRSFP